MFPPRYNHQAMQTHGAANTHRNRPYRGRPPAIARTGLYAYRPGGLGKVKAGADAIAAAPSASAEKGASHGKTICGTGRTRLSGATAAKRKTAFSAACEVFRPGLLQAGEGTSRSSD